MLKQYFSLNVNRMVRPFRIRIGQIARDLDLSDDRSSGKLVRTVYPDMPGYTRRQPVVPVVDADSPTSRWWWTGPAFFVEGFVLYGVSPHPSARFSADEAELATAHARQVRLAGGCPPVMAHGQGGLEPPKRSNVIVSELAAGVELRPPRRGNWMSELGEKVVALWTHWRREREIKSAVAALAKYDERTLRDLGIHGRGDIERMVRYCRDC
jgi:uncharacterized protein YjiS (DUF1127 family)